jgi:methyl-accepting chemotaxis protein
MHMTLKARLGAIIGLLSLLSIVIGLLGLYGMNRADAGLKRVYENRTVALEQISRVDRLQVQNQLALVEALQDSMADMIQKKSALVDKNAAEIDQTLASYRAHAESADERKLLERFAVDYAKMFKEGVAPTMAAMRDGKLADAGQFYDQLQAMVPPVRASVDALRKQQVELAQTEYERANADYVLLRGVVIAAIVIGAAGAVLLGYFLVRRIYGQLGGEPEYAARIVRSIAGGDLTVPVATAAGDADSLLAAMKAMQRSLAKTIGEIRRSADTMATASGEIASGNLDLSERTEQQAALLEETAASMAELTNTVSRNSEHARAADQLAHSTSEVAARSGKIVADVVGTMDAINAASTKIVDIIGVIDSIAFQTNILALNAAVEAARAGEQGRGFAVVAAEVRGLAQRSADAARQIKELIGNSVERVVAGTQLVGQAGSTMKEMVDGIDRATGIMGEITAAGQAQNADIEQVNRAVSEIDRSTQQNAALVEQAAAAAASLQEQAGKLTQLVHVFKLDIVEQCATPTAGAAQGPTRVGAGRGAVRNLPVIPPMRKKLALAR